MVVLVACLVYGAGWGEGQEPEDHGGSTAHLAILPVDDDVESTLALARELAEAGREMLAVDLLLPLLEEGSVLHVRGSDGTYMAGHEEILRILSGMAPESLAHYRLHADPHLTRMVGDIATQRDEAVLREAVYRYFLATGGDEAAWILSGLYLNRGAYRSAIRLLERLLHLHPDSRIPAERIHMRVAIARAAVGDMEGAEAALGKVSRPARLLPEGLSLAAFRETLSSLALDVSDVVLPPVPWAATPSPAESMAEGTESEAEVGDALSFAWMIRIPVNPVSHQPVHHNRVWPEWVEYLQQQIRTQDWRPTEQVHVAGDTLFVHSYPSLLALDIHTGGERWRQDAPPMESMHFRHHGHFHHVFSWVPSTPRDIWSFGSRVDKELLVTEDTVYRVENLINVSLQTPLRVHRQPQEDGREARTPQTSSLVALDRRSGAVRWRLNRIPRPTVEGEAVPGEGDAPAEADGEADGTDAPERDDLHLFRFPGVPVLVDNLLLVPVEEQDGLSILAVDPEDGSVQWRRTLCLYHASAIPPWHGVRMLRQGNDVYVATGMGMVFLLEGQTGRIHWVSGYARSDIHNQIGFGHGRRPDIQAKSHPDGSIHSEHPGGWEDNALILHGNTLVLVPSDAEAIFGFDATTGALKWTASQQEERYLLGALGRRLFVAGRFRMRAIDIHDGAVLWTQAVPRSLGRGILAGDAIHLPTDGAVASFDPETGHPSRTVSVPMQVSDDVLNLFTDGTYLFVAGLDRVWAFAPERVYLPHLHRQAKSGRPGAVAARGLYLARNNRLDEAVDDLWVGWNRLRADNERRRECGRFLQRHYLALAEKTGDEGILETIYKVTPDRDAFRIRARVQAAIHLRHNRFSEAMEVFLALGIGADDADASAKGSRPKLDELFDFDESPLFQQSLLAIAHSELERISARDPEGAPAAREAAAREWLKRLRAGYPDPKPLLRLAFLLPETQAGLEARHRAGRMLSRDGYPELAREAYLACTASADPRLRLAGTAFLADLSTAWGWHDDAARYWRDILTFHPDTPLPWLGRERNAHELASEALQRLQAATPPEEPTPLSPRPPDTLLWSQIQVTPQSFDERGRYPSEFRRTHAILAEPGSGRVRCVRIRDGAQRWEMEVTRQHARRGDDPPRRGQTILRLTTHRNPFENLWQVHESDLLPFPQMRGVDVLGTVTGRLHEGAPNYWRYEVESNNVQSRQIRQGVVVLQFHHRETARQHLTLLCSLTGTPLWSRMLLSPTPGTYLIGGDHLLQIAGGHPEGARVVQPFRLVDGTMEEQILVSGGETLIAFSDRGLLIHAGDAIRMQPYSREREGWRMAIPPGRRVRRWELLPICENMTCLYSTDGGRILMLRLDGTLLWSAEGVGRLEAIDFATDGSSVNAKWLKRRDDPARLVQYGRMDGAVMLDLEIPEGVRFPLSIVGQSRWIPFARPHPQHRQHNAVGNRIGFLDKETGEVVSEIEIPESMIRGGHMNQLFLGQNFRMNLQDDLFIIQTQSAFLVYHTPEDAADVSGETDDGATPLPISGRDKAQESGDAASSVREPGDGNPREILGVRDNARKEESP